MELLTIPSVVLRALAVDRKMKDQFHNRTLSQDAVAALALPAFKSLLKV
jgi:hypothetical protein